MYKGFWGNLEKPIIALAPMDGVTDAAFRFIADTYGSTNVLFTEFTSVEGLQRGIVRLMEAFIYHKTQTPTAAQIFGSEPEAFYHAAFIVAEMGFDGVDINMGCPDPNVAKRGGGAALILRPKLAQEIIRKVKQGVKDWSEGKTLEEAGVHQNIQEYIAAFNKSFEVIPEKKLLPVSVKTRTGYEEIVTTDWIQTLLETEPVNISLHGRTLKQMYTGLANWDEIAKAAEIAKKTETTLLGNGDIKSLDEAYEKIRKYKTDGVLIGRSAIGNPWVFKSNDIDLKTRFEIAIEHCKKFEELLPQGHFLSLRKHLAWYAKGFEGANQARARLVQTKNADEVEKIINEVRESLQLDTSILK